MSRTPVSFTQTELKLLQHVTQPSDMTIEQLVQKMVEYERIQVRAAEIFATDPTKLERMMKITHDPETRPPNFVSLDEPGANIRMFGPSDAVRVNELKESLARSDELLKKKRVTFEECVGLLEFKAAISIQFIATSGQYMMPFYPIYL